MVETVVAPLLRHISAQNVYAWVTKGQVEEMEQQTHLLQPTAEDVLFQIMLEMATVMMKTTILAAILTMTTVVAPMSIQIIAVYVYALSKNIIQVNQKL